MTLDSRTPRLARRRSPTSTATPGILRYRGYPIDELAIGSSFTEVSYLLIYGELPTATELADFEGKIRRHTLVHEDLKRFFDGLPPRRPPDAGALLRRVGNCRPSTRTR